MTSKELAIAACKALDAKKGLDIVSLNLEGRTIICDYFVICSGKNTPQVKALCDNVVEELGKLGFNPKSREGYAEGRWIILDYGDVVVHIFSDETRLFYHIEKLWTFGDNVTRFVSSQAETAQTDAEKAKAVKKPRAKKPESRAAGEISEAKKPRARAKKTVAPIEAVKGEMAQGVAASAKKPRKRPVKNAETQN